MADQTSQVSGPAGEEGLPVPQFSEEGVSSTSADPVEVIVNKVIERLIPQVETIAEKKAKSLQDKRFSKIEGALGLRSTVLAELAEAGVEIPKDVQTEMRLRELESSRQAPEATRPESVRDSGMSQQRAAVTEAITELNKYQLDTNDPEFIAVLRGTYKDRNEFNLAVSRHVVSKLAPPKPASPATATQGAARTSAQDDGGKRFSDKYDQELAKIPRGNIGAIRQLRAKIKQEAKEAGYHIEF